jgi:glycosyltransferase involved in cell wall biosynthesis
MAQASRCWIATELYYPELAATGYFLTTIAEGLAAHEPVSVLCGQPNYTVRRTRAASRERHNDVDIFRCPATRLNKDRFPFRVLNALSLGMSMFATALFHVKRGDRVMAVTNPPFLPVLMLAVCKLKRARFNLLVHDVYPEALYAAGFGRPGQPLMRAVDRVMEWVLKGSDAIVTLGRDMRELIVRKSPAEAARVVVIPHWPDSSIHPEPRSDNRVLKDLGVSSKFVVLYAGTMGRTHGLDIILEAAQQLGEASGVHFILMGFGAQRAALEETIRRDRPGNITLLAPCSQQDLRTYLNACDVSLISMLPGMAGVSVPSRLYNVLASGRPIIALADRASELARVVTEEEIGWVVEPGDLAGFLDAIGEARNASELEAMGARARAAAEQRYTRDRALAAYGAVMSGRRAPIGAGAPDYNHNATL